MCDGSIVYIVIPHELGGGSMVYILIPYASRYRAGGGSSTVRPLRTKRTARRSLRSSTKASLDRLHPGQHLPDQGVEVDPGSEPPHLLPLLCLPDIFPHLHLYRPQDHHHHLSR